MAETGPSRRGMIGGVVGATMAGGLGLSANRALGSAMIGPGVATRLPSDHPIYAPPSNLKAVADLYRRMTVPIMVDGKGPFPFIVDTGANQSVISQELVTALGLAVGASEPLNGVAGVQNVQTTVTNLGVGGRNESGVVLSILPAAAIGGTGMLGLDHLEGCELTLDFLAAVLRIDPAPVRRSREPGEIDVRARRRAGQLIVVDADIAGIPLVAFLDSGAQSTIGNLALYEKAAKRNVANRWVQTPIISVTGQTILAQMADLPHLRIGGLGLPDWPVAFADLHTFQMWDMVSQPAILIGVDVLSRFESVSLDFAHNWVRFRPPRDPYQSY